MKVGYSAIPQTSSGTVPPASRREVAPQASGPNPIGELIVRVTDAGTHANFVATIEGFEDGQWVNLARSVLNPISGLTVNENGIALTAAQALAGVMLNFRASFTKYRLGLAGDNAAADGAGFLALRRDVR